MGSILKGIGYILAGLTVLALFLGVILFVFTIAWMARLILLLVVVTAMILYAVKEALSSLFRKRRSP